MGLKIVTPIFFVTKKIGVVVLLKYSIFFVVFLRKSIFKICLFWKKYLPLQVRICSICRTKYCKKCSAGRTNCIKICSICRTFV